MNGDKLRAAAVSAGAGTGAAALVVVLANAWIDGTSKRVETAERDAEIAIQQASAHGLAVDALELELTHERAAREELERRLRQLETIVLSRVGRRLAVPMIAPEE